MNVLTALDKKVIDLFTDGQAADSKKLTSDGKTLDGNWIGGRGIAVWQNGKIVLQDLGSRSAQIVQNYLRKVTPKNRLLEQQRVRETSMLDLVEQFAHPLTEVTAKAKEAKPKTAIGKALAASFDSVAKSDIVELENKIKEAGRPRSVDAALDFANKILQGHGIEAIRGDNQGGYYQDIVLLYVNQGDAYSLTLCYDVEMGKFLATSYDDWVERYGEERGVQ